MCQMPECAVKEHRKSRKAHKCCECRGTIQPGETYWYVSGIWDGEPAQFKTCEDCEALRGEIDSRQQYWEEQVSFEGLFEWVSEENDANDFRTMIEIKRKRGAKIEPWMEERLNEH